MPQAIAISVGCAFVSALCIIGAIKQVRAGKTWGVTGRRWIYRDKEPAYFCCMSAARMVLGPIALIGSLQGLVQLHAGS
jgi:hypothetical protein